jgi:hypothetical protein
VIRKLALRAPKLTRQEPAEGFISQGETKRFAPWPQVVEITQGREMGYFAPSCVFNNLTPISFRRESRISALPVAMPRAGLPLYF